MQKNIVKKGLVIAVIFLFIAVSFQPVFANELSEKVTDSKIVENEKIEYTIQIIKTNKVIENKVYLTQQQADELENLIENIRADLNNSETQEETKEIYNNEVNFFNNLNLFPKDITINEIKQLVNGETQNLDSIRFKEETEETFAGFDNTLCHVTGETTETLFFAPALLLFTTAVVLNDVSFLGLLINNLKTSGSFLISVLLLLLFILFAVPGAILFLTSVCSILSLFPIAIGGIGCLGRVMGDYSEDWYPASGWISTMGLKGKKSYSGEFYGHLGWYLLFCPGIVGFTGLHIYRPTDDVSWFYFGSALKVDISTDFYPY